MQVYSNKIIVKYYNASKMTLRQMSEKTKEVDPAGSGLSAMTVHRILKGDRPVIDSVCIMCEALGISPKSVFVNIENKNGEKNEN